jgi:formate dehydrogenase (coenzyme F420) beta subunit
MEHLSQQIQEAAKKLFEENRVDVVIGFEQGSLPLRATPFFARSADEAQRLVWNSSCGNNLAAYIPAHSGKRIGIIVKGCDSRSVVGLIKEQQIPRDHVIVIGVACSGMIDRKQLDEKLGGREALSASEADGNVVLSGNGFEETVKKSELLNESCAFCKHKNPVVCDIMIGEPAQESADADDFKDIRAFEEKAAEERWQYFSRETQKCIRCYACRNACPLCYCKECCVDSSQPQWFGKSTELTDTQVFHIMRTFHTAGRCVDCGACMRACPMDVDLRFLNKKIEKDVRDLFSFEAGMNPDEAPPLNTFKTDDPQEFIK